MVERYRRLYMYRWLGQRRWSRISSPSNVAVSAGSGDNYLYHCSAVSELVVTKQAYNFIGGWVF